MKKLLFIILPLGGLAAYTSWNIANKKNAINSVTYTVKNPKLITTTTDSLKNVILKCTIDIQFNNFTEFDYKLKGLNLVFLNANKQIAIINTKTRLNIKANGTTTHTFNLNISLGNTMNSIISVIQSKEIKIDVAGLADYEFMFTSVPIKFNSSFNLAETILQVGTKTLIDYIYKLLF